MKKKVAFIPARSGSKGFRNKNIQKFKGLSLIETAVKSAIESSVFDFIVFSSDSNEYLNIIKNYDPENKQLILHERTSGHLDADEVDKMMIDVLTEVFQDKEELIVTLLYPTSPGRSSKSIAQSMQLFEKSLDKRPVIGVTEFTDYIWTSSPYVYPLNYNPRNRKSRQKHEQIFFKENKSIYIFSFDMLKITGTRVYDTPTLFEMPYKESIDVDNEYDLDLLKMLHE